MVFVSADLAARIEAAESQLLEAIVAGTRHRRPDLDAWSESFAGGCAGYAGPHAPVNKISGLGFGGLPDEDLLADVEARYHQRQSPVVAEVSSYADPAVLALLGKRGYRLTGCEDVLGVSLPCHGGRRADGVAIETLAAGPAREPWFEVLLDGFSVPDSQGVQSQNEFPRDVLGELMRDMASIDDYACYLARIDGCPAGGGALRTHGSVAHLCGAATLPACRGRGVQTSLVTERLAAAASAGCEVAVTVTQPGSKSQQNMIRQGFGLFYVRALMVLTP